MGLADELLKLEELRTRGTLSEAEFAQAKAALLAGSAVPAGEPVGEHLSGQLAEVRHQNDLARLDREWAMEREQYLVAGRYGRRYVPTTGMGVGTAVVGGAFGVIWTAMAVAITGGAPDFGPFGIAKVAFPLFGVVFIVAAIGWGAHCYSRAKKHDAAFQAYQERRRSLTRE